MTQWIKSDTKQIIDTASAGITENGTYYLVDNNLNKANTVLFGAVVAQAGHTATVQLAAEVATAKVNIGAPLVPVFGTPVAFPDELSLTGRRCIIVTGITGAVFPEIAQ